MEDDDKKLKVVFAPGCFDDFDGTQEELDELIQTIMGMAESGELLENSTILDPEDLEDLEDEVQDQISDVLQTFNPKTIH